ncbi:hypothetical protein T459_11471 [Capsicum annuum]|uniref:Uncharacterized protein n=1 Tax=Capsicum annuum TaxID=4072 RepID=A0A2G2ZLZ8_CAPAN|nr:hypothetical protein T459_11471 [Capsicum annuum]
MFLDVKIACATNSEGPALGPVPENNEAKHAEVEIFKEEQGQILFEMERQMAAGRIPRELGNLSFLVSLDLGSNNFHGNLPREMTCLHQLKFLDLSFNNFGGEVPSWFGFLHQL